MKAYTSVVNWQQQLNYLTKGLHVAVTKFGRFKSSRQQEDVKILFQFLLNFHYCPLNLKLSLVILKWQITLKYKL